jgi:hypothetical protein
MKGLTFLKKQRAAQRFEAKTAGWRHRTKPESPICETKKDDVCLIQMALTQRAGSSCGA